MLALSDGPSLAVAKMENVLGIVRSVLVLNPGPAEPVSRSIAPPVAGYYPTIVNGRVVQTRSTVSYIAPDRGAFYHTCCCCSRSPIWLMQSDNSVRSLRGRLSLLSKTTPTPQRLIFAAPDPDPAANPVALSPTGANPALLTDCIAATWESGSAKAKKCVSGHSVATVPTTSRVIHAMQLL